jgi:hypothetical protein
MARSGSTIIASFFNSLEGGFIVGEPHSAIFSERPFGHDWPIHFTNRHGDFILRQPDDTGVDILQQIQDYAADNGADIYGFKDVWTQNTNPLEIVSSYGERLDYAFLIIREPRAIYQSTLDKYRPGQIAPSPITFYTMYRNTLELCSSEQKSNIIPISYELFVKNPIGHVSDITGWEIEGEVELVQFPGVGDVKGRTSKSIDSEYKRKKVYEGPMLSGSDKLYVEFLEKFPHLGVE